MDRGRRRGEWRDRSGCHPWRHPAAPVMPFVPSTNINRIALNSSSSSFGLSGRDGSSRLFACRQIAGPGRSVAIASGLLNRSARLTLKSGGVRGGDVSGSSVGSAPTSAATAALPEKAALHQPIIRTSELLREGRQHLQPVSSASQSASVSGDGAGGGGLNQLLTHFRAPPSPGAYCPAGLPSEQWQQLGEKLRELGAGGLLGLIPRFFSHSGKSRPDGLD